jgi:hypothetical protein
MSQPAPMVFRASGNSSDDSVPIVTALRQLRYDSAIDRTWCDFIATGSRLHPVKTGLCRHVWNWRMMS